MKAYAISAAVIAAILTIPISAQTVSGRVTDPSGAAISGATITLYSRDGSIRRGTRSNERGEFRFDDLAGGEYLLEAQAANLAPVTRGGLVVTGESVQADLRMDLPRASSRVVVTAAGTPQLADETSKAYDVISGADLDARAEYSLVESLRLAPGLRVQQLGGPGSLARIHARGLRAFDTSLLIDGMRIRDTSAPQGDATGFISDVLIVAPDRIEVLRGSGSSLYGTHATGGVVNVVSASGSGPLRGDVLAEGGGLGLARGVARLSGSSERLEFSAGLAHLNVTRGVDSDDRHRNTAGQGRAQWRPAAGATLSARVFGSGAFVGLNISPFAAPVASLPTAGLVPAVVLGADQSRLAEAGRPFTFGPATLAPALNDPDARRDAHHVSAMVAYSQRLSESASLRFSYHGLATGRDNRNGPAGARFQPLFSTSNLFDGRSDTAQARADFGWGRHQLISAGYEFERESYDNLSTDSNPDSARRVSARVRVDQTSHAAFAQDQVRLFSDRLQITLSGRAQGFALSRPGFEGGAAPYGGIVLPSPPKAYTGDGSVAWFIAGAGTKLRAHAGNGYRAPSLYERFGTTFFLGAFSPIGDPRLRPERSASFDLGFDQYVGTSRARISGTFYYTRLTEVVDFDFSGAINRQTDPFSRSSGYRNTRGGLARGVELSTEVHPSRRLRLEGSYTYTNADERNSIFVAGGGLRSIRVFEHSFTAIATGQIGRGVDAAFEFLGASDFLAPLFAGTGSRAFVFPGPRRADVTVNYTRPLGERTSARFFTRIENLFDRVYFEEGFPTPGIWAVVGVKFLF